MSGPAPHPSPDLAPEPYRPPAPFPRQMLSLFDGELLSMLPEACYEQDVIRMRKGKRPITLVNDPSIIKTIFVDQAERFPKSDVMIAALEPLVGEGILISNGEVWRRQRSMLEPAFAQMRVKAMFPHMVAALRHLVDRLRTAANDEIALEAEVSALALEIICRSIFSDGLNDTAVREVYRAFSAYQRLLPQAGPLTLFGYSRGDEDHTQLKQASVTLRTLVTELVEARLSAASRGTPSGDILQSIIDARHADGKGFDLGEIVDQVMVFFLAGHETSASALTWALFILSQQPHWANLVRHEANRIAPDRPIRFEDVGSLELARKIFLETLRLYPPAAFLTRVSKQTAVLQGHVIEAGSLVVVSPWLVHRHRKLWTNPDIFFPERFAKDREREILSGSFIPFGLGSRVCTGRVVAMTEVPLLIAEITRHSQLQVLNADAILPVGRLTIRPSTEIKCRVQFIAYGRAG